MRIQDWKNYTKDRGCGGWRYFWITAAMFITHCYMCKRQLSRGNELWWLSGNAVLYLLAGFSVHPSILVLLKSLFCNNHFWTITIKLLVFITWVFKLIYCKQFSQRLWFMNHSLMMMITTLSFCWCSSKDIELVFLKLAFNFFDFSKR